MCVRLCTCVYEVERERKKREKLKKLINKQKDQEDTLSSLIHTYNRPNIRHYLSLRKQACMFQRFATS